MLTRLYFPPRKGINPPKSYLITEGDLEFHITNDNEVSPFSEYSQDPLVRAYTNRQF